MRNGWNVTLKSVDAWVDGLMRLSGSRSFGEGVASQEILCGGRTWPILETDGNSSRMRSFTSRGSLKTDFMWTFIMWTCVEGACCEQEIDSGCCPRRTLPPIRPTPRPSNMFPTLRKPLRPHVSALRAMVAVKACTLDLEWLFCRLMAASLRTLLFSVSEAGQPCHQYSCRAVGSH